MAPNRTELAGIIDALSTVDVNSLVETKYLPLTHPDEQAQHDQRQVKRQQEQQPDQHHLVQAHEEQEEQEDEVESDHVTGPDVRKREEDTYWDWPEEAEETEEEKRQKLIAKILAEEEARLAVSTATIEAGLLIDTQRRKDANKHEYVTAKDEDAVVDYWDMPLEQDPPVEENEVIQAPYVSDPDHPLASYWDWPAEPASAADRKQAIIAKILEEENIRQSFMVENIERNLKHTASTNPVVADEEKAASSDRYWAWQTVDEADPNSSYWEWQNSTPGELRDRALRLILAEEQIRKELAVDHIEENLQKEAANFREREAETSSTAQKSGDYSYWAW